MTDSVDIDICIWITLYPALLKHIPWTTWIHLFDRIAPSRSQFGSPCHRHTMWAPQRKPKGNHPKIAELFRLVTYYNLPSKLVNSNNYVL